MRIYPLGQRGTSIAKADSVNIQARTTYFLHPNGIGICNLPAITANNPMRCVSNHF